MWFRTAQNEQRFGAEKRRQIFSRYGMRFWHKAELASSDYLFLLPGFHQTPPPPPTFMAQAFQILYYGKLNSATCINYSPLLKPLSFMYLFI